MTARTHNRIALGLSIAALVSFALFHFLPFAKPGLRSSGFVIGPAEGEVAYARDLWRDAWGCLMNPREMFQDPGAGAAILGLIFLSLVMLSGPLLIGLLCRSRPIWWLSVVMLVFSAVALTLPICAYMDSESMEPAAGAAFLVVAAALELLAFFFVREVEKQSAPGPA